MKNVKGIVLVLCMMLSPLVFGNEKNLNSSEEFLNLRTHRFTPCNSWRYTNFKNGSGYMCSFQGMSINVPDSYDLDRTLRELTDRIDHLERRVFKLENPDVE